MQLMYSATSPFTRKVLVAAAEKRLLPFIELVPVAIGPGKTNEALMALNPVGKVPTLVLSDGVALHDSNVIIDYFDALMPEPRLIPASGPARLRSLLMNATADGLITAGVLVRTEFARPEANRWPVFQDAQTAKVRACVARLDREIGPSNGSLTIGEIATAVALGWLDFRMADAPWRGDCPRLAAWYAAFAERPSMLDTVPRA